MFSRLSLCRFLQLLILLLLGQSSIAQADTPIYEIHIRDHLFYPDVLHIPADKKVKLLVRNDDPTPEEFESYELNREKIIPGNSQATIFIGPLLAGEYPFFGEFFPKTAQGKIIVE